MPVGASIHIGLNAVDPKHYSGWDGQLTACEFDANDMQALAKTQGFTKVTKRLTKRATRNRRIIRRTCFMALIHAPRRIARGFQSPVATRVLRRPIPSFPFL